MNETTPEPITLVSLAYKFFLIGALSFGGTVIANIRDLVVEKEKWMDDQGFLLMMSISQALPGLNAVNSTILIGDRLRGGPGAFVAALGLLLPGAFCVLLLGLLYGAHSDHPLANIILGGIAAGTAALMVFVTYKVGRPSFTNLKKLSLIALTFALMSVVKLPLLVVMVLMLPLTIFVYRPTAPPPQREGS